METAKTRAAARARIGRMDILYGRGNELISWVVLEIANVAARAPGAADLAVVAHEAVRFVERDGACHLLGRVEDHPARTVRTRPAKAFVEQPLSETDAA